MINRALTLKTLRDVTCFLSVYTTMNKANHVAVASLRGGLLCSYGSERRKDLECFLAA